MRSTRTLPPARCDLHTRPSCRDPHARICTPGSARSNPHMGTRTLRPSHTRPTCRDPHARICTPGSAPSNPRMVTCMLRLSHTRPTCRDPRARICTPGSAHSNPNTVTCTPESTHHDPHAGIGAWWACSHTPARGWSCGPRGCVLSFGSSMRSTAWPHHPSITE